MKIGLAVGFFDPQVGGSEAVVKELARGLAARGHDVLVATSTHPGRDSDRMVVPVVAFAVSGNAAYGMTGEIGRYEEFLLGTDRDVWLFYAAQIWTTDAALPLLDRIPAATVVAPCGYSGLRDPDYTAYFADLPAKLRAADALVYHSASYQDHRHDVAAGLGGLARVIPNGAADEEFAQPGSERGEPDGGRLVLTVANHLPDKGHGVAIDAFREAAGPADRLAIVGEPGVFGRHPARSCWWSCRWAALRDRRIRLRAGLSREEVVDHYKRADVFLFGSRVECAPLVIVEAMAAGTPFVSTPVGNVADYDDAGLLAAPGELGAALAELLVDPARRRALGERGRARWERDHRWSVVVDAYERLFAELV